ncbi:MAG TPA: transaldolase [Planctomycetota bacterium]|jgi:transaldolase
MTRDRLKELTLLGQSVWYDYIRRDLYTGPELQRLIDEDSLRGMTSNPTIFQKAVANSELYDDFIRQAGDQGRSAAETFDELAIEDVCHAADVFRSVYDQTGGNDGFVSIEEDPHLARDAQRSIEEARRLWRACGRPNVMVKIPGTSECLPAIRQCLAEGININITLLFSVPRYRKVIEAYLSALEDRVGQGLSVDRVRSVASFFVSRVDTNTDKKLDFIATDPWCTSFERASAQKLRGKLGIANAKLAYHAFDEAFTTARFAELKGKGAAVQRPLWASTSSKDPAYPDLYYVEALIAPNTVDTMPQETFDAFRDHGDPRIRIYEDLPHAWSVLSGLRELHLDAGEIADELEGEGLRKFSDSYDAVLKTIEEKERTVRVG